MLILAELHTISFIFPPTQLRNATHTATRPTFVFYSPCEHCNRKWLDDYSIWWQTRRVSLLHRDLFGNFNNSSTNSVSLNAAGFEKWRFTVQKIRWFVISTVRDVLTFPRVVGKQRFKRIATKASGRKVAIRHQHFSIPVPDNPCGIKNLCRASAHSSALQSILHCFHSGLMHSSWIIPWLGATRWQVWTVGMHGKLDPLPQNPQWRRERPDLRVASGRRPGVKRSNCVSVKQSSAE